MPSGEIDWNNIKRVLVVRMRSIGDTVLTTPSLTALRRFLPEAEIDVLLEAWVAPILDGFDAINRVIPVGGGTADRWRTAREIRRNRYDVVFNLHGGTTSTFLTFATGAKYRVGFSHYQYRLLHNTLFSSSVDYWNSDRLNSAEQQLALLGLAGVPVSDRPKSRLAVTPAALGSLNKKFKAATQMDVSGFGDFALMHPAAAFATKQWATENFARTAEFLSDRGFKTVAVAASHETSILDNLKKDSRADIVTFGDLTLPEITALASKASLFVGNDSGIAHIASALNIPAVVIFGSSNRVHWRPWTDAPNEIVFETLPCQPCPGNVCAEFGEPRCIMSVRPESVIAAIDLVLETKKGGPQSPPGE